MSTQRTSNKQILEAINAQTSAINALVGAIAGTVNAPPAGEIDLTPVTEAPVLTPVATPEMAQNEAPKVPASYLNHMTAKVTDTVNSDGKSRIMYLRRNLAGETKLAYCLAERWSTLKDRGLIGAVKIVDPAS